MRARRSPPIRRYPAEQFAQYVHGQPRFTKHNTRSFSANNDKGQATATVTMDLVQANGAKQLHLFPLVKEGGVYKVCGDPY
jgi:hypothetical protein